MLAIANVETKNTANPLFLYELFIELKTLIYVT
jgi:hypothetical protein